MLNGTIINLSKGHGEVVVTVTIVDSDTVPDPQDFDTDEDLQAAYLAHATRKSYVQALHLGKCIIAVKEGA